MEDSASSSAARFEGNGVARVGRLAKMISIWPQNRSISFSLARKRVFVFVSNFTTSQVASPLFVTFFFFYVIFFLSLLVHPAPPLNPDHSFIFG